MLKSPASQSKTSEYLKYRQKLLLALKDLPQGEALGEALVAERDFFHLVYPQEVAEVKKIQVKQGHGVKSLDDDSLDTHFHAYLETIINPQIRSGIITDGTNPGDYDERKLRWSGAGVAGFWSCKGDTFTLKVGPTSYPNYRLDLARSPLETMKVMYLGLEKYQDPYAYFCRGIGVAVVPISKDGSVYLGERSPEVDCTGILNFVAGWATFSSNIEEIDFLQDAQRELWEEVGIAMNLDQSNTKFIGMSGNPVTGEVDLVFIVQTEVGDRHFQSGEWEEHSRLVRIKNKTEAETLLEQGLLPGEKEPRRLMFSSRFGLEYLVQNHW